MEALNVQYKVLVNPHRNMYIGRQAIISPGELFPNAQRLIPREQIEADAAYRDAKGPNSLKRQDPEEGMLYPPLLVSQTPF